MMKSFAYFLSFSLFMILCVAASAQERDIASLIQNAEQSNIPPSNDQTYNDHLKVLDENDVALYREIFNLQKKAKWSAADRKINQLNNKILLGYVQHQRLMHPTGYRSKFAELREWMAYYADHPEAKEVYALARKRRGA